MWQIIQDDISLHGNTLKELMVTEQDLMSKLSLEDGAAYGHRLAQTQTCYKILQERVLVSQRILNEGLNMVRAGRQRKKNLCNPSTSTSYSLFSSSSSSSSSSSFSLFFFSFSSSSSSSSFSSSPSSFPHLSGMQVQW